VVVNKFSLLAGKLSYSIYLLHPPTILFLIPVYRRIYGLGLPTSASFLLSFGVTFGLVLPASLITYYWIEEPGMKLGKQLLARRQIGPIATVTDARPI
jgi:peptidoglycan/LPS O-acetylase OafA/YrhL